MGVEQLVKDLKKVRERGVAGTTPNAVPALMGALAEFRPDIDEADRGHHLEEFLTAAADQLDGHDATGIRLALGLGGLGGNSADRRSDFAAHYNREPETVRRKGALEDQAFTRLAREILSPRHDGRLTTSSRGSVPGPLDLTLATPMSIRTVDVGQQSAASRYPAPDRTVLTSRARAYLAIDSLELDLEQFVDRYLLRRRTPEEVFGLAVVNRLTARQASVDVSETGSLVQHLHPQESFDILLRYADALPTDLADLLQVNLVAFESFIPVRNRLMHGRPLQPEDLDNAEQLISSFPAALFPKTAAALDRLSSDAGWQPRPRVGSAPADLVLHNLPEPDFDETGLLGREEQVANIVEMVKRRREPITLVGEGGIGKTALAMEVCYRLIDDPEPPFEAILWTSLKTERLTRAGVQDIADALRDIEGVTHELGQAIDSSFVGNVDELATLIGERSILIIIDNLETVRGDEVVDLYDRLPRTVTFLFTSRVGVGKLERPVHVGPLEAPSAELLFRRLARNSGAAELAELAPDDLHSVLGRLRYSPLAIRWYILSIEGGKTPDATLRDQAELLEFCVANVIDALGDDETLLLDVLRILDRPVSDDELAVISDMDIDSLRRGAQHLTKRSLLVRTQRPWIDETELLTLSSTARDFLPAMPESALIEDVIRREAAYSQDLESERRWTADRGQYFDPNIVLPRSSSDDPLAYLLRRALRENKSGQSDAAAATIARARAIDRSYFEIDRVDAFFASTRKETARATMLYRSALASCDSVAERCWVGYFYSAHLARAVVDIPAAIKIAEETHTFYDTYDTAHHLGNFYVWDGRFKEGERLLACAIEGSPTKEFSLKATTSLIECLRQWSTADLRAGVASAALDHALRGIETGLGLCDSGSTDERLMRAIIDTAITALQAVQRTTATAREEGRLSGALHQLVDDTQFRAHPSWINLEYAASSLPDSMRSRVASGVSVITWAEGRLKGTIVRLGNRDRKFGFIEHPDFPNDVFLHGGSLLPPARMADLTVGASVIFTPTKNAKGQDVAQDVIVAGRDPEAEVVSTS